MMPDYSTVDFFSDRTLIDDPVPYYEFLRSQGSVWREPVHGAFVITGYEEISTIFRDVETFSSCNSFGGPFPGLPEQPRGDDASELIERYRGVFPFSENFITFDPPAHTAHRGLMMRLLTPKRLQENEAFMWTLADTQIDRFWQSGRCDFVADYAQPFALLVIADLLGVPDEDRPVLRKKILERGAPGPVGRTPEGNILEFLEEFFIPYVEASRRQPRDDVLTKMALAKFPDGSTPDVIDVVRVAAILFAGGQGTAARFHTGAIKLLAERPELQAQLRQDRGQIPDFIEEMLRLGSPTKISFRMARKATTLAGVSIPPGSTLMLLLAAADRDPTRFGCPADFQVDRADSRSHVAFGRGIHSCPGGPLVRAEARVTLDRVLDRMDDIRISEARHGPPDSRHWDWTPSYILRGVEALHLEFTPTGQEGRG
jgi:cytochrome P450